MNFQQYHTVYLEAQNAMDFLMNPENSGMTHDEVIKKFKESGGTENRDGSYGAIYFHPKWNYVLKTFIYDPCYLRFLRFIKNNPHKAFPVTIGSPQKIYPSFRRKISNEHMYIIRLEKLEEVTEQQCLLYYEYIKPLFNKYFRLVSGDHNYNDEEVEGVMKAMEIQIENLKEDLYGYANLIDGFKFLIDSTEFDDACFLDIHCGNIMRSTQRNEFVIIDPFAPKGDPDNENFGKHRWNITDIQKELPFAHAEPNQKVGKRKVWKSLKKSPTTNYRS